MERIFYSRLKRHLFFKGKAAKNLITFVQLINARGPLLHLPKESLPRKKASLLANEFATFSITFPVSVPHLQPARCPRDGAPDALIASDCSDSFSTN